MPKSVHTCTLFYLSCTQLARTTVSTVATATHTTTTTTTTTTTITLLSGWICLHGVLDSAGSKSIFEST